MESSLTPGCCWVRKICLLSIALSLFATTTTLTYAKPITISRESSVNRVIKSNSLPSNYYHNNNNDNSKSALSRNLLKECIEAYLGNIQVSTDDFEFLPMVSIHADASSTSPLSASHKNTDIFTLLDAIPNVPKKSILSTLSSRQKLVQPGTGSGSFSMAYLKFLREYVGLGIALHGEDGEKMLLEASQSVKEKEKKMKNLEAKIKREYDAYLQGLNESNDTKTVDFSEWSQSQTDYQIAKNAYTNALLKFKQVLTVADPTPSDILLQAIQDIEAAVTSDRHFPGLNMPIAVPSSQITQINEDANFNIRPVLATATNITVSGTTDNDDILRYRPAWKVCGLDEITDTWRKREQALETPVNSETSPHAHHLAPPRSIDQEDLDHEVPPPDYFAGLDLNLDFDLDRHSEADNRFAAKYLVEYDPSSSSSDGESDYQETRSLRSSSFKSSSTNNLAIVPYVPRHFRQKRSFLSKREVLKQVKNNRLTTKTFRDDNQSKSNSKSPTNNSSDDDSSEYDYIWTTSIDFSKVRNMKWNPKMSAKANLDALLALNPEAAAAVIAEEVLMMFLNSDKNGNGKKGENTASLNFEIDHQDKTEESMDLQVQIKWRGIKLLSAHPGLWWWQNWGIPQVLDPRKRKTDGKEIKALEKKRQVLFDRYFGKDGDLNRIHTSLLVGYQPTIEITSRNRDLSVFKNLFDYSGQICLFGFCFGQGLHHSRDRNQVLVESNKIRLQLGGDQVVVLGRTSSAY